MTKKWQAEFVRPRGPANVPQVGDEAPDFTLPYARFFRDDAGEDKVEYGRSLRLSDLRGRPVVLNLTRIVSDRFF
jgi:peroxiredoxin